MNCPYCNKSIEAMTGFQEVAKFQKHLQKCRKNPKRKIIPASVDNNGFIQSPVNLTPYPTLTDALEIRATSGQ